jgi:hypothetical protein
VFKRVDDEVDDAEDDDDDDGGDEEFELKYEDKLMTEEAAATFKRPMSLNIVTC